jgi:hypothetical protein
MVVLCWLVILRRRRRAAPPGPLRPLRHGAGSGGRSDHRSAVARGVHSWLATASKPGSQGAVGPVDGLATSHHLAERRQPGQRARTGRDHLVSADISEGAAERDTFRYMGSDYRAGPGRHAAERRREGLQRPAAGHCPACRADPAGQEDDHRNGSCPPHRATARRAARNVMYVHVMRPRLLHAARTPLPPNDGSS